MDFKIQKALEISPENFKIQKLGENFKIQKALENSPENFEFQKLGENSPENFKIQKLGENFKIQKAEREFQNSKAGREPFEFQKLGENLLNFKSWERILLRILNFENLIFQKNAILSQPGKFQI